MSAVCTCREPVSAPMSRRPCTLPSSPALRARSPTYTSTPICARTLSPTLLQVDYKKPQPTKGILKTGKYSRNISKELIVLKDVSSKSEPIEIKHIESKNVDLNLSIASSNGSSDILDFRRKLTSSIHEISNSIFEETDSSLVDLSSLESFKSKVKLKSGKQTFAYCRFKTHPKCSMQGCLQARDENWHDVL